MQFALNVLKAIILINQNNAILYLKIVLLLILEANAINVKMVL